MTGIKFIYFDGCPNAGKAKDALVATGVDFEEIEQTALPAESPFRGYSSPTILKGDAVVCGAVTGEEGGCSLHVPTEQELRDKLLD